MRLPRRLTALLTPPPTCTHCGGPGAIASCAGQCIVCHLVDAHLTTRSEP